MGLGEIGEALRRSTVHIRGAGRRRESSGSGVIWDSGGTVITNAHVAGTGDHSVDLWDGRSFAAQVEERDDQRDLAILKLSAGVLPAVLAREDPPKAGETVIAVGNPLGFTGAMSTGVVRATGPIAGLGRRGWIQSMIQLAPGNSGGPLADSQGRLLGINTMIVSGGIALAIPTAVVEQFLQEGSGPRLGVTVQAVNRMNGKGLGLLVLQVDQGSPAEQASLLIGDVLVGTHDTAFQSVADLGDAVAASRLLRLRFLRGDSTREREVSVAIERRRGKRAA